MKNHRSALPVVVAVILAMLPSAAYAASPVVGPETRVSSTRDDPYTEVTAAADPTTGQYLVVTEDFAGLQATLVSTAGDTPSAPSSVNAGLGGRNPDVAFDGERYLIVVNNGTSVYGRFIGRDGAAQNLVFLGDPYRQQGPEYQPSVAWQPSPGGGGTYVVAYVTNRALHVIRFGPHDHEQNHDYQAPKATIATSQAIPPGDAIRDPDVIATASGVLVGWEQGNRAYVAALSSDLTLVAPPTELGSVTGDESDVNMAMAGDGSALATWVEGQDALSGLSIYGAVVRPDGSVVNPKGTNLSGPYEPMTAIRDRDPGVAWNGRRYILTWFRDSLLGVDTSYATAVSVSSAGAMTLEPRIALGETSCCTTATAGPVGRVAAVDGRWDPDGSLETMVMRFIDEPSDAEAIPLIGVDGASVAEGSEGQTDLPFIVSLDRPANSPVTVDYATRDVSATSGSDYTHTSGTLTFQPGETSAPVNVRVTGDVEVESDEALELTLTSPTGASLDATREAAIGTILNDDAPPPPEPSVSIDDMTKKEGHRGTSVFRFSVTLSSAANEPVEVSYATQEGTATAGTDFTSAIGSVTIPVGSTSGNIDVDVAGDKLVEADEVFQVRLSAANGARIGDDSAMGTIVNDDRASRSTSPKPLVL